MAGPWEKYQSAPPAAPAAASAGPWDKYKTARVAPPVAPAPAPAEASTNPEQAASQGVAGINEGIAGTLSAPNNLIKAIFNIGPEISRALGGNTPDIAALDALPDAGKSYTQVIDAIGANRAPTGNIVDHIMRSTGNAVGGALIPELGMTAKAGGTVVDALKGLLPAATSGAGGGVAEEVAPGNPVAELIGETAGGLAPTGARLAARTLTPGKKIPDLETLASPTRNADLKATKTAAYDAADATGAQYSPAAFQNLAANMATDAQAANINPMRHPAATAQLQAIGDLVKQGYSPTLTELDQLRQTISRDVAKHPDAAEAMFGKKMIESLDNFINTAGPGEMVAGAAPDAAAAINTARSANTTLSKTNAFDDAIQKAVAQTASTGSGGNINNALRQQFRPFLTNPDMKRGLTPEEVQAIVKIVQAGPVENGLRLVGKLAPGGNGLMTALNMGAAAATHGASMVVPAVASLAKGAADRITEGRVMKLRDSVATGQSPSPPPVFSPEQQRALIAAIMSGATNAQGQ